MMNKFIKIVMILLTVSFSVNISAGSGNEWFKKHPVIKGVLVTAATIAPTLIIPVALTYYDYINEVYRAEYQPGEYLLSETARAITSVLNNTKILTAEEIFIQKVFKNIGIGIGAGFGSYLFANNYPTEYLVAVALGGFAAASCGAVALAMLNNA
jgi:hypothetical protein